MTVTTFPSRNEVTASAGQTVFNYTFLIFSATDLNVYITPTGQDADDSTDITTAYTVDTATIGNPSGGFITLNSGTTALDLVTIVSNIPENRTTDYQNSGDFLPDTVNADFDKTVALIKQQEDSTGRTLSFPQSKQNASALSLPDPTAGQYLVWNPAEDGLINAGAPGSILPSELDGTTIQMVANASLVAGEFILTSGYSTDGDGGDNVFLSRAVTGATADGGSLIKGVGNVAIEFVGLFPGGVLSIDQWGAGAGGDQATTLQAALDYFLANGGRLEADGTKSYRSDSVLTFLNTNAVSSSALRYLFDFKGAELDFSSSGLTSGSLLTIGSTTVGNFEGVDGFSVKNIFIKGPETLVPTGNSATGTTVGLDLTNANNVILENVFVQKCFEGIKSIFTFPLTATQCDGSLCWVPLHLIGASNDQLWNKFQATDTSFGIVIEDSAADNKIVGVTFIAPRIEGADAGIEIDPGPGSTDRIRDITIINPYFASITADFIRIGTTYSSTTPLTRGATRTSFINGFICTGGNWANGGSWSGTKAAIFSAGTTLRAADILLPAVENAFSVPNNPLGSRIAYIGSVHDITTDYNNLVFDNDGEIVSRLDKVGQQYEIVSFTSLDATPDVTEGNIFLTANAGSTTITAFDGLGTSGKNYKIIVGDANTTFDFSSLATIRGNEGEDYTARLNDVLNVTYDGTNHLCEIVHTGSNSEELTIATGVITITSKNHPVDTEADAASDDLDTINGGNTNDVVTLRAVNDARTVVVKDGTGNIQLDASTDFSLDNVNDRIVLQFSGTGWVELSRSPN